MNNIEELLKEKLIIPEIQRDYVWGNNELVIKRFINNIKNMKDELDIGFFYSYKIYGNYNALVDGQQRITTLILLSWYVGVDNVELNKFKFKVRENSNNFLEELLKQKSEKIFEIDGENFSDKIKNSIWYKRIWDNDPTVKSILNALDIIDIELKNNEKEDIKNKINNIKFSCIEAGNRSLEKEYILLNSRGVKLTNSEQLKAILTEDIENKGEWLKKWEKNWQDILWECKGDEIYNTDKIWDAVLYWVRDIYVIENNIYKNSDKEINYNFDLIGIEKENREKLLKILDWIIPVLKIINDNLDIIQEKCQFENVKTPIINIKDKIQGKVEEGKEYSIGNSGKALFYSILYLIKNEYNIKSIDNIENENIQLDNNILDKIRIFRNLIQNSNINASNLHNAMNSLNNFNIDTLGELEGLDKEQQEEEALKLKIFEKYKEYKDLIIEIENDDLFRGKIKDIFLLLLSYKMSNTDKLSIDNLYKNYNNRQFLKDNRQSLLDIQFDLLETLFKKYKETNENKNNIWFELLLYSKFYRHNSRFIYFSGETKYYFQEKEKKGLITLVYLYFSFQDIHNINDFQKKHQEIKLREVFKKKYLDYNYIEQLYILYAMGIVSRYKQFRLYSEEDIKDIIDENQKLNLNNSPFINKCIFYGYRIRSSYPKAQLKFGENLEEKLKKLIQEYSE